MEKKKLNFSNKILKNINNKKYKFKTSNNEDIKATGIILYKTNSITGELNFLIQKKKNKIIEDFGGKIDKKLDDNWIDSAIREFKEETNNEETKIFDLKLIKNKIIYNNEKNYIYIPHSKYMLILINYSNMEKINLNFFSDKENHTGIIRNIIWISFNELYLQKDGIYDPMDFIKLNIRLQYDNFFNRIRNIKYQSQQKSQFILKKWINTKNPLPCFLFNEKKIIDYNNIKMKNYKGNIIFPFTKNNLKIFHKYIFDNKDVFNFINKKNIKKKEFNIFFETSLLINNFYHNCKIQRIKFEYKTFLLIITPNLYANKFCKNNYEYEALTPN